jgi:hypothetical protein
VSEREKPRWWKTGYGRVTAVLGIVGVVFTFAQLPVQLAGFPQTVKGSINVVQDLFASKSTVVTASSIGPYDIRNFGITAAIDAFGSPESKTGDHGTCTLRWPSKGIEILFVSTTGATCVSNQSGFCAATLTTHQWRTQQGLHVGDSVQRLHSIYPDAPRADDSGGGELDWILDGGTLACPDAGDRPIAGLRAVSIGENVDHLALYYFSALE